MPRFFQRVTYTDVQGQPVNLYFEIRKGFIPLAEVNEDPGFEPDHVNDLVIYDDFSDDGLLLAKDGNGNLIIDPETLQPVKTNIKV